MAVICRLLRRFEPPELTITTVLKASYILLSQGKYRRFIYKRRAKRRIKLDLKWRFLFEKNDGSKRHIFHIINTYLQITSL